MTDILISAGSPFFPPSSRKRKKEKGGISSVNLKWLPMDKCLEKPLPPRWEQLKAGMEKDTGGLEHESSFLPPLEEEEGERNHTAHGMLLSLPIASALVICIMRQTGRERKRGQGHPSHSGEGEEEAGMTG